MQRVSVLVIISFSLLFTGCQKQDFIGKRISSIVADSTGKKKSPPTDDDDDNNDTPQAATSKGQAKIIRNNPVFMARSSVGYAVSANGNIMTTSPSSAVDYDQYLSVVELKSFTGDHLKNADIDVRPTMNGAVTRVKADASGNFGYSTVDKSQSDRIDKQHRFGQVMAYHWISQEKEVVNGIIAGGWAPTGKNIKIYSYCEDAGFNAYWDVDNNLVCMGYVGPFEAAYDASVFTHEMGHANIDFATRGAIHSNENTLVCRTSSGKSFHCCESSDGCIGAINEGQADVHSYIMFNSPALGEFFTNSVKGLNARQADENASVTAQDRFSNGYGKEIHSLGGIWGAAWWTLRKRIGSAASDKIFFSHLHLLAGDDDFRTALTAILTAQNALVASGKLAKSYQSDILAAFQNHGISPSPRSFVSLGQDLVSEFTSNRYTASSGDEPSGFFSRMIFGIRAALSELKESIRQVID